MNKQEEKYLKKYSPYQHKELVKLKKQSITSLTKLREYEAKKDDYLESFRRNPHGYMNFAPSIKQKKALIKSVQSLKLNTATKELIYDRTSAFFKEFREELLDFYIFRETRVEHNLLSYLDKNFEKDIDHLLNKYRSKFNTPEILLKLAELQQEIMNYYEKTLLPDSLESLFFSSEKSIERDKRLISKYAPSNRPSFACYPPYLEDIISYIKSENTNYMSTLVKFLKSLQNGPYDVFDSFIINPEAIRALLTKHRRSPSEKALNKAF